MLEDIKKIMGFNNNEFDEIIKSYIASGKQDLKEVGIASSKVESVDNLNKPDHLIYSAIISYVLSLLDIPNAELYLNSYLLQKDTLRHYGDYIESKED